MTEWTDEEVARLKDELASGVRQFEIAKHLGKTPRAVSSKIDRLRVEKAEIAPPHGWTKEREAQVVELNALGWSRSRIGRELGITRNAVTGKLNRLGLSKPRQVAGPRAPKPKPVRRQVATSKLRAVPAPLPERVEGDENICFRPCTDLHDFTIHDLTDETCRWPIGHPGTADFFFCGAQPLEGSPYCPRHTTCGFEKSTWRESRRVLSARSIEFGVGLDTGLEAAE